MKLSLNAAPTFKAKVAIPVAGGKPADVEMVFKHRTKKQIKEFLAEIADKEDTALVLDMVSGWELEDPFSAESVDKLLDSYPGAALAIHRKYLDELYGQRLGN